MAGVMLVGSSASAGMLGSCKIPKFIKTGNELGALKENGSPIVFGQIVDIDKKTCWVKLKMGLGGDVTFFYINLNNSEVLIGNERKTDEELERHRKLLEEDARLDWGAFQDSIKQTNNKQQ